ncbi:MAG: pyridoxal phosphate-dependent aminotransferase [Leptospirales bacterium]|nr:pyridoxal phosphate-dependent aminotransferase [Leptospirales bacterium]
MQFSAHRLEVIEPSPTLALSARAKELKAAGKDIVGFGAGEPDFDTPEHIKEAARRALAQGQTKYTAEGGSPAMKKAIIEKMRRDNHLDYSPAEVMASNGGKQVIYNLFMATLNPGDEVVIPAPYWVSYADIARLAEAKPVFVHAPLESNYLIHADQLRAAITPRTRLVVLNSPNNPTGAAYSRAQLQAIVQVLIDNPQTLVMSDDIYEHIVYEGFEFVNVLNLAPELRDRTVVVNGVSKAYAMTGWRLGSAAGPEHIIKNMEKLQGQSTSNPCSITQAAAIAAFTESQDCVETMRIAFQKRRDLVVRMLQAIDGVRTPVPQGAFYVFPNLAEIYKLPRFQALAREKGGPSLSRVFCNHLLDHYDVAAVPGIAFGDDAALRISYALDEDSLRKGIDRLGAMVQDLRG